jgi:molybdenum cofactor synthesis domain-containing protein
LLSNVCCEDVENVVALNEFTNQDIIVHPPAGKIALKVAILTMSDRAAANAYPTGDLSGPSVHTAILSQIEGINSKFGSDKVSLLHVEKDIVPDELDEIKTILLKWSGKTQSKGFYDIIFTTGGTGFATRDVTPEATLTVIERECHGLMSWASLELTKKQPLATLSRASAGICGKTIIINLPGSPTGASEVVRLLFPLLLHAVNDVKAK